MTDYQKMYYSLCRAADRAIDLLKDIPSAAEAESALRAALLEAEEVYVRTCGQDPS